MSKKKKRTIILSAIALLVLVFACCYTVFLKPLLEKEEPVYKESVVEKGKLVVGVTESGTAEFKETTQLYDLDLDVDEDEDDSDDDDDEDDSNYLKVEEVYVAVGQRMKEGDPLYRFTEKSVENVRRMLNHELADKKIALSQAETEYQVGTLESSLSYDENTLQGSLAEDTYKNSVATLYAQVNAKAVEIEQTLDEILTLQLSITNDDYCENKADIEEAYEDAVDTLSEDIEDSFTNSIEAQVAYKNARSTYDQLFSQIDETNEEIEQKINQVWKLQAELERTQALLNKDLLSSKQSLETSQLTGELAECIKENSNKSYQSALNQAKEDLTEIEEQIAAFEAFLQDNTVYASGSGLITTVGYEEGDELTQEGVLVSYVKEEDMTITVDVSEEDIINIAVGDQADITFTAYDGEEYSGVVKAITTTKTSEDTVTVSYPVEISISGDTSKLYSGMTADVTFKLDESDEVPYISKKAIVKENGKQYVYVKQGKQYVLSEVETGFSDGISVEITKGLSEGDTYYILVGGTTE